MPVDQVSVYPASKTDITAVKTAVEAVETKTGEVKTAVNSVETEVTNVETKVGEVKTETENVKTNTGETTDVLEDPVEIQLNSRIVVQPGTHYTCPTGRKAIFRGFVKSTGLGAASSGNLRDSSDSFNIATWRTSCISNQNVNWNSLCIHTPISVILFLTAGQTIKTTQNSGTNAEFVVVGAITEVAA